jgi:ATP adenylyltransferase
MKHLYAPWRGDYITDTAHTGACVFCEQISANNDAHYFIIQRFTHCFVMLNLFPYNAGHVMVIPYRHVATLTKLTPQERGEMMEVSNLALIVLKKSLKADGFNLGVNLGGKAAGGSIPRHLHMHVLPRWHGDTSFLTTLAETKQISVNLTELYRKLKAAFAKQSLT